MFTVFLGFSLFIWFVAVGITLGGTLRAIFYLRRTTDAEITKDEGLEPITILKPLKGMDPGLEENLKSFLTLDYPAYEVLFSVATPDDPVIPLVKTLMGQHPKVSSRLFVGAVNVGMNPKINNLLKAYENAKHDWILISDSNTRFTPSHLKRLASQFKDGVSMQTSVVAGVGAKGLGGLLETTFLNTFYARSMLILDAVGHPCVMGKAMLFRKSVMDKTRGLRSLNKHIAEDYAAGRKFHLLGYKVMLSRDPVRQPIGRYSIKSFWSRHVRWGRIRKMQAPLGFLVEPLFSSLLSGALGAFAFSKFFGVSPAMFLTLHFGFWFLCDFALASRVGDPVGLWFPPVWVFRELIHMPLWAHISMGSVVNWRGQKIRLKRAKILETRAETFTNSQTPDPAPSLLN